jgi:hypothetical protein
MSESFEDYLDEQVYLAHKCHEQKKKKKPRRQSNAVSCV